MKFPAAPALCFLLGSVLTLAAKDFTIPIKQYTLKNGLKVILSEDHAAPTLAVVVCYDVGSGDERTGRTGFAHFFEHMMFSGLEKTWNTSELSSALAGAVSNANTSQDRTLFYDLVPANQFEIALSFEASRMRSIAWTQENVESQRASVKEERRLRIDNVPYGKTSEVILDVAHDALPYKHVVFGSMKDLDAATLEDFQAFYRQYYAPNNAAVIIVGDFKSAEALAAVKKHFEHIQAQAAPPRPDFAEPIQTSERRTTVEDAFARAPRIDIAFKIPPGNSPDWYPIAVMTRILGRGDSSRLYERLVRDTGLASNAYISRDETRGPGLATISLSPLPGKSLRVIEEAVCEEIAKLQSQPVEDWEMEKVRMAGRRRDVENAEAYLDRASSLAEATVVFGDPNLVNMVPQRKAGKTDVMRVARKYFTETNRTVVITLPKGK